MRPDRLLVGEVRQEECLDLLSLRQANGVIHEAAAYRVVG
jgi:Flp pilus assembly CpaF family ATPase